MTTPSDCDFTARLLHLFDAGTLGDGNLNAGANVLVAMALALANVQRPGAAVAGKDGSKTELGCSLVVSGALSSSLTAQQVITPLRTNQDNVSANVRHWEEDEKRRWDKLVRTGREADGEPENPPVPALSGLDRRDTLLGDEEHVARSLELLDKPPGAGFREICRHPLVFGIAGGPETFQRMMERSHLGRPLVHVALYEAADCPAYQKVAGRLMHGCQLFEPGVRSVRGELLVTDPHNALGEAVRGGLAVTGWMGNALWMADHAAGPEFEAKAENLKHAMLDQVATRFRLALTKSWAERLSAGWGKPAIFECEVRQSQHEWVNFLLRLEPSFPGITGALRPLPASLLYGLHRMRIVLKPADDAPVFKSDWVYAFARMLALRMTNARELMLRYGRQERIEAIVESVRRKLADGPLTVRDITRRSHRLAAADCEAALEVLLLRGQVKRTDNVWHLRETFTSTQALTLGV